MRWPETWEPDYTNSLVLEAFPSSLSWETNSFCQSCRLDSGSQIKWGPGLTMSPFWPGAHYSPDWASSSRQSSCLWLPSTKITSIDQHSQLQLNFCIPCPDHSSPPAALPVALPQDHLPSSASPSAPWCLRRSLGWTFYPMSLLLPVLNVLCGNFIYAEFLGMSLSC